MRTETMVVGLLAGLLVVGGGAAVAVGANPLAANEDRGIEDAELASFDRTQPFCVDERPTNASTEARSVPGGTQLIVNDTMAVGAPDGDLTADLRTIGPKRHVLALSRVQGDDDADCDLAIRYEATVNLTAEQGYTLLRTEDRVLTGTYWSEPGAAGASQSAGGAEARPESNASGASGTSAADGASEGADGGSASGSSARVSDV